MIEAVQRLEAGIDAYECNRRAKRDPIETELNRCSCIKGMTVRGSPPAPIGTPAASGFLRASMHLRRAKGIALPAPVYNSSGRRPVRFWVAGGVN
jgi:hypothetical protein